MIRFAAYEDLDDLVTLCRLLWEKTDYKNTHFDFQKTAENLSKIIQQPNEESICLVDDEVDGMIIGMVVDPLFTSEKSAFEIAYYATPGCKEWYRLVQAYIFWARELGCKKVHFGSTEERLTTILEKRMNFSRLETTLQKELH